MTRTDRPNVLFIIIDAARADRFGCYGYPRGTTAAIDDFSRSAAVYDHMIAPAPWTLPSHASIFTGLYSREHGADRPAMKMRSGPLTLAAHLERQGYAAAFISNNPLVSRRTGVVDGAGEVLLRSRFDAEYRRRWIYQLKTLVGRSDSGSTATNRVAGGLLSSLAPPFFLFINYMECHWKYHPPRSFERRFVRRPYSAAASALYRLRMRHRYSWDEGRAEGPEELGLLNDLYDASLACVDDRVGDLLEAVDRSGKADETVIIVSADHGECIGEHGLTGHGMALYETLLHVPFIARIPGRAATRVGGLVQLTDLFAGLCTLTGVELPEALRERPFSVDPFRLPAGAPGRAYAFAEMHPLQGDRAQKRLQRRLRRVPQLKMSGDLEAVRDHRYKLIVERDTGRERLYDLQADPHELQDRVDDLREPRERLVAALQRWRIECQPSGERTSYTPEEERAVDARLRELGYL